MNKAILPLMVLTRCGTFVGMLLGAALFNAVVFWLIHPYTATWTGALLTAIVYTSMRMFLRLPRVLKVFSEILEEAKAKL